MNDDIHKSEAQEIRKTEGVAVQNILTYFFKNQKITGYKYCICKFFVGLEREKNREKESLSSIGQF